MFALLDYYGHQLAVDETVRYTNQTGVSLSELVMAVEPNLRGGFTLENILLEPIRSIIIWAGKDLQSISLNHFYLVHK